MEHVANLHHTILVCSGEDVGAIEIPAGLRDALVDGEDVNKVLRTRTILNKSEHTFLTDRRILYFNETILDRSALTPSGRAC